MHAYLEPTGLTKRLRTAKDKIRQRTIEAYKLETNLMKKIIALAVAAVVAAPAMADLTIGGSTELNLAAESNAAGTHSVETNVQVTAMSESETGMYVKAFAELELLEDANSNVDIDDNYLEIGAAAANVSFGERAAAVAWKGGDDSFAATTSMGYGFTGKKLDSIAAVDTIVNITAVEGLTLQVAGNLSDNADGTGVYAGYSMGGFGFAANIVNGSDEDGYAVSGTAGMGGATVSVSYAKAENKDSGLAVTAAMGAVDVTIARMKDDATGNAETVYYGRYNLGNMGVEGFNVDVGAGSGTDAETRVGAELTYTF